MAIPFILNNPSFVFPPSGLYTVWLWGRGDGGELAQNNISDASSPVQVIGGFSFSQASLEYQNGIGLDSNGQAWTWGDNASGQLGDNTTVAKSSPVAVVGSHSFIEVRLGYQMGMGLKADGSVWGWGRNAQGELGDQSTTQRNSPVQVVGGHSFIAIASNNDGSFSSSMGLKADGSVWCWGNNNFGALGNNTTTNSSSPVAVVGAHSFVEIACSGISNFARKADGSVWAWGYNGFSQLGDNVGTDRSSPIQVVGNHSFIKIVAGWRQTFGLKANGEVWGWGFNLTGTFGNNVGSKLSPVNVVIGGHSFIDFTTTGNTGSDATNLGLKADGSAWAWGHNAEGMLGNGTITPTTSSSPTLVIGSHSFATLVKHGGTRTLGALKAV